MSVSRRVAWFIVAAMMLILLVLPCIACKSGGGEKGSQEDAKARAKQDMAKCGSKMSGAGVTKTKGGN